MTAATPEVRTLFAIRINVKRFAVPVDALRLHLKFLGILIAMAVNGNLRTDRNDPFLEPGFAGSRRRRQSEIPYLAFVVFDFHRRMRPGKAYTGGHGPGQFEFFILISAPS